MFDGQLVFLLEPITARDTFIQGHDRLFEVADALSHPTAHEKHFLLVTLFVAAFNRTAGPIAIVRKQGLIPPALLDQLFKLRNIHDNVSFG